MAQESDARPLVQLVGDLASNISSLLRKEIELAKTETSEKISQVSGALTLVVIGAVLAVGALGVVLAALVTGIAAILVEQGMSDLTANGAAAAIVAIVVGLLAWMFVSRGIDRLKGGSLTLDRTTRSLGRDAALIKEKL
ncbi:Putative Holin-X, holin superfamily III [Kaistia soli DSM 19436]|uniref:Putative Holin-X, holin superfamily III n=1 Tax=Kaistia soli DSM 19436 TaxID=1122133 RepID=A0A1M5PZC7_9HYPH|nr:phage holin family protein [Kaistia soli]SHH07042.1 Putative Holin-X, holin superfamily III [Kaistia soli DSM 19436]